MDVSFIPWRFVPLTENQKPNTSTQVHIICVHNLCTQVHIILQQNSPYCKTFMDVSFIPWRFVPLTENQKPNTSTQGFHNLLICQEITGHDQNNLRNISKQVNELYFISVRHTFTNNLPSFVFLFQFWCYALNKIDRRIVSSSLRFQGEWNLNDLKWFVHGLWIS